MFNYVDRRNVGVEKKGYLCLTMWIEETLMLRKRLLKFNYVDRRNDSNMFEVQEH